MRTMDLVDRFRKGRRAFFILAALLTTFAGADLILNTPKGSGVQWAAIPLLAAGAALFAWVVWPRGVQPIKARPSLATNILFYLTWRGRLIPYLPAFGIALIAADLAYNLTVSATPSLLTEDTIVILGAASLVAYGFVPEKFSRERDFILVFFLALNAILVVPLLATRAFYQDFEQSVDFYSWIALAPPTSAVLSAIGVQNSVHPVLGSTAPGLTFVPQNIGIQVTVVITTACSGIYSFGIFASAFVAFVLTEYRRPGRRVWALLGLGLLAAYIANVLRMVVIVLVGYYTDTLETDLQNMLLAHSYAGWLIFLGWIALFWAVLLKFMPGDRVEAPTTNGAPSVRREAVCGICSLSLSPVIPATRCACGAYHHRRCFESRDDCPSCGRSIRIDSSPALGDG